MALSNIGKEPRREILESAIGIAVVLVLCIPVYYLGRFLQAHDAPPIAPLFVYMIPAGLLLLAGYGLFLGFLYGTHALGEYICGKMANLRIDPRPKIRYRAGGYEYDHKTIRTVSIPVQKESWR